MDRLPVRQMFGGPRSRLGKSAALRSTLAGLHGRLGPGFAGAVPRLLGRRRAASAGVAATVAASLIAACGGSGSSSPATSTIDAPHVAHAIADSIDAKRKVTAQVTCPSGVPLVAHRQFMCVAEVDARNTPFAVTEINDRGSVTFAGVSPSSTRLLDDTVIQTAIARLVASKKHTHATVRCPAGIPVQKGLPFVCVATAPGGSKTIFKVDQTDAAGHVNYAAR
jgi:hypothetical protein